MADRSIEVDQADLVDVLRQQRNVAQDAAASWEAAYLRVQAKLDEVESPA